MHKVVAVCLLMSILFCGCGREEMQSEIQSEPISTAVPETGLQQSQLKPQKIVEQLNQVSATGEIVAIVQREDSLFCVQKEREKSIVYSWDLKTGDKTKKELSCSLLGSDVQLTEGYVVFYEDSEKAIVLDQKFSVVDEITIKDKIADGLERNYCVLPGEKRIVYTKEMIKNGEWYQEVNECDYSGKNKRRICRIEDAAKSVGKVNEITKLAVSNDEKNLFYSGLYFKAKDKNETSSPCFGEISRETGEVVSVQEEKSPCHLLGNKMIFVDGLREKGVSSSGYITCLDENGMQEKYSFRKKEESQEVSISDEGNYYLGYEKMDKGLTKVSCYSFKKGAYQWERELPQYVSGIWYFEQPKMLLYAYYDDERKLCFEGDKVDTDEIQEENYFDLEEIKENGQNIQASFSFGVHNYDEDKGQIQYDGGELQVDFQVSPEDCSFECSVLIYVDGIIQKYALESHGTLSEQHTVKIENQTTIISAYFTPQIDASKKKHRIHFLCMYDPECQPGKDNSSYGNSHKISQVMPWELIVTGKCEKAEAVIASEKVKTIPKGKRAEYERGNEENKSNNSLDMGIEFETERGKKEEEITFRILGGMPAKYRISAYVGHKLVDFSNGSKYIDVLLDGKHMYEGSLPVGKMADKEYDTLYFIAIPISNLGTAMVKKSSSICLYHGGIQDVTN